MKTKSSDQGCKQEYKQEYVKLYHRAWQDSSLSDEEKNFLRKKIDKKLEGIKGAEKRAEIAFWCVYNYIFEDTVEKADKGKVLSYYKGHSRLFKIILLLQQSTSDELLRDVAEHLDESSGKGLERLLMHCDSEHHGVITLAMMRIYRRLCKHLSVAKIAPGSEVFDVT